MCLESSLIGDKSYRLFFISEHDIFEYKLIKNDWYLILASDGLWNELPVDRVNEFILL